MEVAVEAASLTDLIDAVDIIIITISPLNLVCPKFVKYPTIKGKDKMVMGKIGYLYVKRQRW